MDADIGRLTGSVLNLESHCVLFSPRIQQDKGHFEWKKGSFVSVRIERSDFGSSFWSKARTHIGSLEWMTTDNDPVTILFKHFSRYGNTPWTDCEDSICGFEPCFYDDRLIYYQ